MAQKTHSLHDFYLTALGHAPYPYQQALAHKPWPHILHVPTGLGKTAAIILAWLQRLSQNQGHKRLVWCLPMRVLVEQTASLAQKWIDILHTSGLLPQSVPVYVFMGGHTDKDWVAHPEQPAILIGTQDQLLSRALNRGYAMSRYRWPMDFSLLHNDCLWIFDEVQLMGAGLPTSAQLHAFRERFGTFFPCHSLWCSATLRPDWLATVDFAPHIPTLQSLALSPEDEAMPSVAKRLTASKTLYALPEQKEHTQIAETIIQEHQEGTRTLVICNTVKHARDVFSTLEKKKPHAKLLLLHSRFRPVDKEAHLEKLLQAPPTEGIIAVTTQVIEAGVDISAATLFTALAPWASLVQRFGRCNRSGEIHNARVFWIDTDLSKPKNCLPYTAQDLYEARETLQSLCNVSPKDLPAVRSEPPVTHILRGPDMIELFDTTADISGADIDISRYIRESDERDIQVFWRNTPQEGPAEDAPPPQKEELCAVSLADIRPFLKNASAWKWDYMEGQWFKLTPYESLYPGMVLWLDAASGGYTPTLGFVGSASKKAVTPLTVDIAQQKRQESNDSDTAGGWESLYEHGSNCAQEMEKMLAQLAPVATSSLTSWKEELHQAAFCHDWGKAHAVFQEALPTPPHEELYAKAPSLGKYARRGFRHELASALALLHSGHADIVAYLAAAHHGKVRLSLRSLPQEAPATQGQRFARGIWEGDILPKVKLYTDFPATTLSLACMEMGTSTIGTSTTGTSWLERMLNLRDHPELGIFRLAYLETLVRVADWRASSHHEEKESCQK